MKEVSFIRQNIDKWKHVEHVVEKSSQYSPDELADTYNDITADLSFSQSHYPDSRITIYLNNLSYALHHGIYKNKHEKASRFITYWTQEIPQVIGESRKDILISLAIFVIFTLIGALSAWKDENFARLIMGDNYVEMTLRNIEAGNPMGVYGKENEALMFLGITLNNVWVSFYIFISGLVTYFGTGLLLMYNGIMLGCFHVFLAQQGVLGESMLAIWMHGVLEISAIIIAGGAGIALGSGWLFPGTYSRIESFMRGAKRGLKIVIGTVPIFIIAGFIEGFITRHTETPNVIRLVFILLCLSFISFYYIYLPYKTLHHGNVKSKN